MDVPRQHKRLRRINAGATSGNSNKSENEIQELDVVGNMIRKSASRNSILIRIKSILILKI